MQLDQEAFMTTGQHTAPTPPPFGAAGKSLAALVAALDMPKGCVRSAGFATFPAVRVTGPGGQLLVSVHDGENGVVFLAPPVDAEPGVGVCEVIGTAGQLSEVAGIVRRRVFS